MRWTLDRILFLLMVLTSAFFVLSLLNYIFRFANPGQPLHRLNIGLAIDTSQFVLSAAAYLLIRARKMVPGLAVTLIWAVLSFLYSIAVLVFEPLSGYTIGIFSGYLLICGFLTYCAVVEAQNAGVLRRVSTKPGA